jgi:DNA-binding NarL/FixJ family response regulator
MHVIVADDETRVRSALQLLLERELDLWMIDEATGVDELLHKMAQREPDLLLLDWELPELNADCLATLQSTHPHVKTIDLSGRPDARRDALTAGVNAFACKVGSPDLLILTVRALLASPDNGSHSPKKLGKHGAPGKAMEHAESGRTVGTRSEC